MAFAVRYITSAENELWDQLVNSSSQGSVFLLSECLSAQVETDPQLYLIRLGCFDDADNLVGGQTFIYKKALMICTQTQLYTWDYINTPIIAGHIAQSSTEYFDIVYALADKIKTTFLYYEGPCHPSIQDVRPLLQNGWSAEPYYVHMWDLRDPESMLRVLKGNKRFHQVDALLQSLNFAVETGADIIDEFTPFYEKTTQNIGYKLNRAWKYTFRAVAGQMLKLDAIRFFTCRDQSGDLLGAVTIVLDRIQNTAYGWQLAHIPLHGEKSFMLALCMYSIKALSTETSSIDISRGIRPSLYYFKDSLGTKSIRLFSVETPYAKFFRAALSKTRDFRRRLGFSAD